MAERISSHFDKELEHIRTEVLRMGSLLERQLQRVLAALTAAGQANLEAVLEAENEINRLEISIDDACQNIIARRQPAASDLRFVLTVVRVIVDLERIGDELKKIVLIAHDLFAAQQIVPAQCYDTYRLAGMTAPMLQRAMNAFDQLDTAAVLALNEADRRLDLDYRSQSRVLITYMMEQPHTIGQCIEIMMMNKAVERVGDHAKNIAEHVVYWVRGIDVRHLPAEHLHNQVKAAEN